MMIRKHLLKSGLTLVSEEIDYTQSVSMGLWVKAGSRHESGDLAGISHFLEHMNFKGTATRSARDLAEVLECRGGQLNAYTTKEYTNFYCRVVREDMALALDVLSDIFLRSRYDEEELEKEKNVVIEEINLYEDSPDDLVLDKLSEVCWDEHPLARPILGYEEQVRSFTPSLLKAYRAAKYRPDETVLAVVGHFDYEALVAEAEKWFTDFPVAENADVPTATERTPVFTAGSWRGEKDIAQEHVAIAFPAFSVFDDGYYPSILLNEYLGGAASSVLFQKIREELALSYSVYSYVSGYEDCGAVTVYAGTSPGNGEKVRELCFAECAALAEKGIDEDALARLKQQLNGSMRLAVDSLGSRLNRLGRNELFFGRYIPVEEVVGNIDAVTCDDVVNAAAAIFQRDKAAQAFLGGRL